MADPTPRCAVRRHGRESGIASVWVLALTSLIAVATAGGLVVAGVVGARHAAEAAADLSALAGAVAVRDGADGCAAAGRVALANRGQLDECRVDGDVVHVAVSVTTDGWWAGTHRLRAAARAGPATGGPGDG